LQLACERCQSPLRVSSRSMGRDSTGPRVFGSVSQEASEIKLDFKDEEEGEGKGKGESETKPLQDVDIDGTRGLSKSMLVSFFVVALLVPGGVLVVYSFIFRSGCSTELDACYTRCQTAFAGQERVFKTDYHPEQECRAYCDTRVLHCRNMAFTALIGGGMLVAGLVFGLCLLQSLEAILESFSRRGSRPRPAYKEPIYTEEELRKMERPIGRRERAFWKFVRRPVFDVEIREVMCRDCHVPVEVDSRWLSGDRGGMHGARCSRCYKIIVGVL